MPYRQASIQECGGAPDENRIAGAEARLNERIASLQQLLEEVPAGEIALRQEGEGLLASAYKRLGEMYHRCGRPGLSIHCSGGFRGMPSVREVTVGDAVFWPSHSSSADGRAGDNCAKSSA